MSSTSPRAGSLLDALETAGATDVGQVRMVNQDAFDEVADPAAGRRLLLVADGMGGHRGGEVASRLTVETVRSCFSSGNANDGAGTSPGEFVRGSLETANRKVYEKSRADAELAGMGTTAVALLFDGSPQAWVAHVGDSRAYRLRSGELTQITDDHSVVGELVRRGQLTAEEARVHPQSNEILRAIGTQPTVEIDVQPVDVVGGDRFLLCSDGLSGMVRDEEIAEVLGRETPSDAVRMLIERANLAGGTDNITVLIASVGDFDGASASRRAGGMGPDERRAPVRQKSGLPGSPGREASSLPWLVVAAVVALVAAWWLSR